MTTTIKRASELKKGDRFLVNGIWRTVVRVDREKVWHKNGTDVATLGARSQQFFEVKSH